MNQRATVANMIKKITQKRYKEIEKNRRMAGSGMWPGIYFEGPDGNYYVQTTNTPAGTKEVAQFKRKLKRSVTDQMNLF